MIKRRSSGWKACMKKHQAQQHQMHHRRSRCRKKKRQPAQRVTRNTWGSVVSPSFLHPRSQWNQRKEERKIPNWKKWGSWPRRRSSSNNNYYSSKNLKKENERKWKKINYPNEEKRAGEENYYLLSKFLSKRNIFPFQFLYTGISGHSNHPLTNVKQDKTINRKKNQKTHVWSRYQFPTDIR